VTDKSIRTSKSTWKSNRTGCDSGLFSGPMRRRRLSGRLDYLPGGTMVAGTYGERLTGVT